MEAETPKNRPKIQQKHPGKHKREAQEVVYATKGYWIKEKKKVKINGVEKEVTVIKDSVFSPDVSLLEDQDVAKDTWCFAKFIWLGPFTSPREGI